MLHRGEDPGADCAPSPRLAQAVRLSVARAALVAIALVVAVVAEHVTSVPSSWVSAAAGSWATSGRAGPLVGLRTVLTDFRLGERLKSRPESSAAKESWRSSSRCWPPTESPALCTGGCGAGGQAGRGTAGDARSDPWRRTSRRYERSKIRGWVQPRAAVGADVRRGLEASHHPRRPELVGRAADRGRIRGGFAAVRCSPRK